MLLDPRGSVPLKKCPLDSLHLISELADVLPPCSPEEDAQLDATVRRDGPVFPWIGDEFGGLIDGWRTYLRCKEHGITHAWVITMGGLTLEQKRNCRLELNIKRRRLNREQMRDLIRRELRLRPAISGHRLAYILGIDHKTVLRQKRHLICNGEIPRCPIEASDGRVFRKQMIISPVKDADKAQRIIRGLGEDCRPKIMNLRQADRLLTAKLRKMAAKEGTHLLPEENYTLNHCDCRDLLAKEPELRGNVDLILTDPIWTDLALYEWLADFALAVLKPDGLLVVYAGPKPLEAPFVIAKKLQHVWTISAAINNIGRFYGVLENLTIIHRSVNIYLFNTGGNRCRTRTVLSDGFRSKHWPGILHATYHPWELPLQECVKFITTLTRPGDRIVDPFGGSFVGAAAAKLTGRCFTGHDVVEEYVHAGRFRLAQIGLEEIAHGKEKPLCPELFGDLASADRGMARDAAAEADCFSVG
jgi:DNA modification methylase